MSKPQKDATSKLNVDSKREQQLKQDSQSHKGSGHHDLPPKSAPANTGKSGSHKAKGS